jgi:Rrf2 family protein
MKAKYALKALACLANAKEGEPLLIADIAESEGIPKKILEAILAELKQHGLLRSRKGRGGGYFLAKPPEQVTVAAVLRVIDGPIAPVPCLSRTAYRRCDGCRDEATCTSPGTQGRALGERRRARAHDHRRHGGPLPRARERRTPRPPLFDLGEQEAPKRLVLRYSI